MPEPHDLLLAALRSAPRRYRMPPLMPDAAAGPEARLARAIEGARTGQADAGVRELFTHALAELVAQALPVDAALQALVLREEQPRISDYMALAAGEHADRRRAWAKVDAFAHPGKLRSLPPGAPRAALERLHALARDEAWAALRAQAQSLAASGAGLAAPLSALLVEPALARLEAVAAMRQEPAVQQYLALCAAQGPAAGSGAAAERGRVAAAAGEAVEAQALQAFATIAHWMSAAGAPAYRAAQGLRPAAGFPPPAHGAKDEWDVALLRDTPDGDVRDLVLLAECKAAPLAAAGDWPRLLAGLRRLSAVDAAANYGFTSTAGPMRVRGASLRTLAPRDDTPPPHVLYACSAVEQRVPLLAPGARAMLLQEPVSVAFARALGDGAQPPAALLAPLLDAVLREPRLRPVLLQYESARRAREAMLHPDDLLAVAAEAFGVDAQGLPRNR